MTPKQRIIAGTCEIKRISTLPSATKAMFDAELVAGTMQWSSSVRRRHAPSRLTHLIAIHAAA